MPCSGERTAHDDLLAEEQVRAHATNTRSSRAVFYPPPPPPLPFQALFEGGRGTELWNNTSFLWSEDFVWGMKLHVSPEQWQYLLDKPDREEYVEGSVEIAGLGTWNQVGIRFKVTRNHPSPFDTHTLHIYLLRTFSHTRLFLTWCHCPRPQGYMGSLRICLLNMFECKKLSYKLKFNFIDKNQRFYGLKKLQLHSSFHDPSFMRERISYR